MLLHCLQNVLVVASLAGASGAGCFVADPALEPPKAVTIALGESVKAFLADNRIALGPRREADDFTVDVDRIADDGPIPFTDHWLGLTFADGPQGFVLPPGRRLVVGQTAGRITDFVFTPFAAPRPLGDVTAFAATLFDGMQDRGWSAEVAVFLPRGPEDFDARTHSAMVSQLHGQGGHDVELIVREAGALPRRGERLLTPVAGRAMAEAQPGYVLEVGVTERADAMPRPGDTIDPRRLLMNHDESRPLRLRPWVDDPDWTPRSAGMVPTAADPSRGRRSGWMPPTAPPLKR